MIGAPMLARAAAVGVALTVGVLGGAVAVMAVDDANSPASPPTTTTTEVAVTENCTTCTTMTSAAPAGDPTPTDPPQPAVTTLAPGFEDYQPGDPLPAAPPAPASDDEPVSTVPGPHGPIYPDGYVAPEYRTPDQGGTAAEPVSPLETLPPPVHRNG